jgi:hypothetical protein
MGKAAFTRCGIHSIGIPRNVELIGEQWVDYCQSLCEVTFESDSKLKEICAYAFGETGVDMIEIPAGRERLTGLSLDGMRSVTVSNENKCFILRDSFVVNLSGTKLYLYCFDILGEMKEF